MTFWRDVGQGSHSKTYSPEPEKNVVYSEDAVAAAKRSITATRRAIEDKRIDRETEERLK